MHRTPRILIIMLTVALSCGFSRELNDAQIQAAIEHGINTKWPKLFKEIPEVRIKHLPVFAAPRPSSVVVGIKLFVLSDSIRISLAASAAKSSKRQFSVQDARASAIRLGMVTVLLEAYGRNSQQWLSTKGARIMLKADDKIIQPLTLAQYRAAGTTNAAEIWDFRNYSTFSNARSEDNSMFCAGCALSEFVFPVIERAQRVTVVVTGNDGRSQETVADPALFESR
jgi:hypothetical protein